RGQPGDFALVVRQAGGGDDLDRVEARAIVHVNEREARFRVATRSHPPLDGDPAADRHGSLENSGNTYFVEHTHAAAIIRRVSLDRLQTSAAGAGTGFRAGKAGSRRRSPRFSVTR